MANKLYRLYCEICNWKKITDGKDVDGILEIKTSPIPGGIPQLDPETKEIKTSKSKKQPKKLRCPKCGRVVIPREINDPQTEADEKKEMEKRKEQLDEEIRVIRSKAGSARLKI